MSTLLVKLPWQSPARNALANPVLCSKRNTCTMSQNFMTQAGIISQIFMQKKKTNLKKLDKTCTPAHTLTQKGGGKWLSNTKGSLAWESGRQTGKLASKWTDGDSDQVNRENAYQTLGVARLSNQVDRQWTDRTVSRWTEKQVGRMDTCGSILIFWCYTTGKLPQGLHHFVDNVLKGTVDVLHEVHCEILSPTHKTVMLWPSCGTVLNGGVHNDSSLIPPFKWM